MFEGWEMNARPKLRKYSEIDLKTKPIIEGLIG